MRRVLVVLICLVVFVLGVREYRHTSRQFATHRMLHQIGARALEIRAETNRLPNGFEEIQNTTHRFEDLRNPLTGDDPGYAFDLLPAATDQLDPAETVLLYQLRDGVYDPQLRVCYLDGTVRSAPKGYQPKTPVARRGDG